MKRLRDLTARWKHMLFSESQPFDRQSGDHRPELQLPSELLWLLDAPLFIDAVQVDAFYDAILRPDYEGASVTLSQSISAETSFGGQTTVGAAVPWLAKAEIQASFQRQEGTEQGRSVTLTPISNAHRHLFAVALYYASQPSPNRLVIASPATARSDKVAGAMQSIEWLDSSFVEAVPRALVFLDMEPKSKFIPAALELANGEVMVVANELASTLKHEGSGPPAYREARTGSYFEWFFNHFDDRAAINIVEKKVRDQTISWIDYNVSLAPGAPAPFLHLHLMARSQYPTGVFAYNFITRGYKYGLRIVGTLKSGPDLNVLAVFER
jgi:hypothetical protein